MCEAASVVDLPQQCKCALYEEAAARYASAVKSRAVAVYRTGHARYPGLSGLDLIVVVDRIGVDNRFFFSALQRLPQRYHGLFPHEPFILPGWSLRVMRYTTHYAPRLLGGREVLSAFRPSNEPDERWCRTLESYCAYAAFAAKNRRTHQLEGRQTIAAASALRSLLGDAAHILPDAANDGYVNEIDAIRRRFFDEDPVEGVRAAWVLFANAFDRFDAVLRKHVGAASTDEAVTIARGRLRGEDACADFDREYAFRRERDIGGYHQELISLGFPFGDLFFDAAHGPAVLGTNTPIVDMLLRNVYRMRRRLTEYAG